MKEKKTLLPSTITDAQLMVGDAEDKGIGAETESLAMYITPPRVTEEKRFFLGETPSPPDSGFVTPCSKDSDVDRVDPWALPQIDEGEDGPAWIDLTCCQRIKHVLVVVLKIVSLIGLLYLFICSLGLLSDSFQLVGGKAAGAVFSDSKLLRNPIAGLMIGVLGTVLLQSSSTSTSIVVGLVASEMLTVRQSIPIVMGANIGTSVTNTIVSVAHSGRRAEFRRAFAGATVHDMFNWLCVIILLPVEIIFGYLFHTTGYVVGLFSITGEHKKPPKLLQHLTEPFTNLVVQLDKSKISAVAMGTESSEESDSSLIRRNCAKAVANATEAPFEYCKNLFAHLPLSDATAGVILLVVSLVSLVLCLVLIVKLLNTMLRGHVAKAIRKTINNDLPGPFAPFTDYVGIAIGAGMTILIQSSSVFTSTLTPLVAVGVLSLERMYPLTLGANVGTTFTSLLAALASPPARLTSALQISLCHLFFNLTGILMFFVIPVTRQAPLGLARILGNKTAKVSNATLNAQEFLL
uniref:Sodium-dependent phosphate transport protein 2B n=1 Tax=Plectus sambesii TaxID=2011161 RepID=A0A914XIM3_9BILA